MAMKLNIALACFLIVNIAFTINAQTVIPANAAEVERWFQSVVKPIRYTCLFPNNVALSLSIRKKKR